MTLPISIDFREEAAELYSFLQTLTPEDWDKPTLFMDWTPWDVVAHLHYFDEVSTASAEGEEAFAGRRKALMDSIGSGISTKDLQRKALGHLSSAELLEAWKTTCDELSTALGELNPKARLPWFGPDMGASMFTTARYMETWAHSQEIYDLKKVERTHSDRIQNIVAIGVKTFGWTFVNRKIEIPGPPPYLRLTAPSGAIWEYNAPVGVDGANVADRIEGDAVDFCLAVTQVRNVRDTNLSVVGDVATEWMAIAQCFAGAPTDPPAPGYRTGA